MNYEEFKQTLKEEIQARCSKQINFMEDTALKSNEVLESLCVHVPGDMVMSVNNNPDIINKEDFLSDSVYKYNAKTHSISVCDSNGLFHDKSAAIKNSGPVRRMAHRH